MMLSAVPPEMVPTLTVEPSTRPRVSADIADAAAWMAWMPLSGENPAWAERPVNAAVKERMAGAWLAKLPMGPERSRI